MSEQNNEGRFSIALKEIMSSSPTRTLLSVFLGFFVGAVFMVAFNEDVIKDPFDASILVVDDDADMSAMLRDVSLKPANEVTFMTTALAMVSAMYGLYNQVEL